MYIVSKRFFFQTISYGIIFNRKGGGRVAIGAIKKRGIDGVKCPSPFSHRWNFSGQAQPVTRDNPAANESNSRRGFSLVQGELVCKPRNSPRSVRVSMIFTVPSRPSSSSSTSLLFSLYWIEDRDGIRRYSTTTKVWQCRMDARIRNDRRRIDPILGKNSIPINGARPRWKNRIVAYSWNNFCYRSY